MKRWKDLAHECRLCAVTETNQTTDMSGQNVFPKSGLTSTEAPLEELEGVQSQTAAPSLKMDAVGVIRMTSRHLPVEVFLKHPTGSQPKDIPRRGGDYSSSSWDLPGAGICGRGKGRLGHFAWFAAIVAA